MVANKTFTLEICIFMLKISISNRATNLIGRPGIWLIMR